MIAQVQKVQPQYQKQIIEILEMLLEKARAGEIMGLVAVTDSVSADKSLIYTSDEYHTDLWRLMGALEYAKATVMKSAIG